MASNREKRKKATYRRQVTSLLTHLLTTNNLIFNYYRAFVNTFDNMP